jgi:acetyl esterase/lipase
LPEALADTGAVAFDGGIVVVGGRSAGGKVATVMELAPR